MIKPLVQLLVLFSTLTGAEWVYAEPFKVASIDIEGLQRISHATVLDYIAVKPGQVFDTAESNKLIKDLYATHFFNSVTVARKGNVLLITVQERPTIASIKISGYQSIDKDKIQEVMKNVGLIEGQELDEATLTKFTDSLQQQYYQMGRYNAHVTLNVSKPDQRNRVTVQIDVSEGRVAKIEQIQILGNKVFTERELIKQLDIATTGIFSFFTKDDEYSREKLDTSLDKLLDYYQDHGYLRAKVDSSQAQLSPKRDSIYVTIKVTEGEQYKVSDIKILGNTIIPLANVEKLLQLKAGDVFSKAKLKDSQTAITDAIGDKGYAFASISVVPAVNDANKTVALTLFVDPGQKVYVRKISFSGNNQTSNIVFRREMRQDEGALSSTSKIKESERRIKNIGTYIQDAKSTVVPVPGKPDQVDINYNITETAPASAIGQLSYGTDGFGYGASLNNANILGSGKALSLGFNHSPYVTNYNINYMNPYYTIDGISRSINVFLQKYNPGAVNIANYALQNYGFNVMYGVPVSEKNDRITFGYGYEHDNLGVGNDPSQQVLDFFNKYNDPTDKNLIFNQLILSAGWARDNYDRAFFPTNGLGQVVGSQVSTSIGKNTMKYYKVNYAIKWFHPIVRDFVFTSGASASYGNGFGGTGDLPFFQNFYAGGVGSVRGFENNTLGPRDSLNNPIGGNALVTATAAIIFPNFISPNTLRTSWFVDAGNVYNTHANKTAPIVGASNPSAGSIRYSTGLDIQWKVPIVGMLDVSFASPINAQRGDEKQWFQFNFGTQF